VRCLVPCSLRPSLDYGCLTLRCRTAPRLGAAISLCPMLPAVKSGLADLLHASNFPLLSTFRSALLAVPPGLPGRRSLVHRPCQSANSLRHNNPRIRSHDFHCNIALQALQVARSSAVNEEPRARVFARAQ
jgi:hypothetical protein